MLSITPPLSHVLRPSLMGHRAETVRFETAPGRQLQADFGEMFVMIAGWRAFESPKRRAAEMSRRRSAHRSAIRQAP